MEILYSNDYLQHDPEYEYYDGVPDPYAEKAARMTRIIDAIREAGLTMREVTDSVDPETIARLHSPHYLRYLHDQCAQIPEDKQLMPSVFIRDTYTPLVKGTYAAALKSASIALAAADEIAAGRESVVYALCRPPGHHAERDAMSGYCYFNNAALAADRLAKDGKRVAVLDVDYHHGNGTQNLFYERDDVLYVSIHADPTSAFPYGTGYADETGKDAGLGYTVNLPLSATATAEEYQRALQRAIDAVAAYSPDYLVLSLGFDTYRHDTLTGGLGLDDEDYATVGRAVAEKLAYPTVVVQEGGYNVEKLGDLAVQFVKGYIGDA